MSTVCEQNYELRNVSEKKNQLSSGLQTGPLLDGREGSARGLSSVIYVIILILHIILLILLVLVGGQTFAQPLLVSKVHALLFNAGKESNFSVCNSVRYD